MTAIFIGIILSELNNYMAGYFFIYLVWRIGYKISLLRL